MQNCASELIYFRSWFTVCTFLQPLISIDKVLYILFISLKINFLRCLSDFEMFLKQPKRIRSFYNVYFKFASSLQHYSLVFCSDFGFFFGAALLVKKHIRKKESFSVI